MEPTIAVNQDTCSRCGACATECPTNALVSQQSEVPVFISNGCIRCGHCGAVCPLGAITSADGVFTPWTKPSISPEEARAFLTGRRSVRHYREAKIPQEVLVELMGIASYASTASNAQDVSATVLTGDEVYRLGSLVNDYYASLIRLLSYRFLKPFLLLTPLQTYIRNPEKLARVRERVQNFSREKDWLFFRAPAVVVLSAPRKNTLFGRINCTIAAERIMQYAAALGIGSCYIGFADVAIRRQPKIAQSIGIDPKLVPFALFTLGYPTVQYRNLPARRPVPVTWRSDSNA
jgi:nitroreductase/NAD-dependent dihydropyrimidine dehydrogenase PreA subunit